MRINNTYLILILCNKYLHYYFHNTSVFFLFIFSQITNAKTKGQAGINIFISNTCGHYWGTDGGYGNWATSMDLHQIIIKYIKNYIFILIYFS